MRTLSSLRRLMLSAVALLAAACADHSNPIEPQDPPAVDVAGPDRDDVAGPLEDLGYWADGYLRAWDPVLASYTPYPAFNRSGGAMTVKKVAGTTGRYIARFKGLSALLGGKSSVHVTGTADNATYCKPVAARLAGDSVEVRCYRMGTGAAVNATFTLLVSGKHDDRAFAHANQPAATGYYSPAAAGSWNPAGATRVHRYGLGLYQVTFVGLGGRLPANIGGHVQVNAVGPGKTYCKVVEWGGSKPDLSVWAACYTPGGTPADAQFTALFTPPAAHLAYIWGDSPTAARYTPYAVFSSNPVGGAISVTRSAVGKYKIVWTGVDQEIRDFGNVQVTAYGEGDAQCKTDPNIVPETVYVSCFAANGVPMDSYYTVLLAS